MSGKPEDKEYAYLGKKVQILGLAGDLHFSPAEFPLAANF